MFRQLLLAVLAVMWASVGLAEFKATSRETAGAREITYTFSSTDAPGVFDDGTATQLACQFGTAFIASGDGSATLHWSATRSGVTTAPLATMTPTAPVGAFSTGDGFFRIEKVGVSTSDITRVIVRCHAIGAGVGGGEAPVYAHLWSDQDQTFTAATPTAVVFHGHEVLQGVTHVPGSSVITIDSDVILDVHAQPQIDRISGGATQEFEMHIRKNGVAVPKSGIRVDVDSTQTFVSLLSIPIEFSAGDTLQIFIEVSSTDIKLAAFANTPDVPGIILAVTSVGSSGPVGPQGVPGPAGTPADSIVTGSVTNLDPFRTSTSLRRPEACDWDVAELTFTCWTDNAAIMEEFTRNGTVITSLDTMTRAEVDTWINGDADRNLDGFAVAQMNLEWEAAAIHPITGDAYIVNNVNDHGGVGDCADAVSGVDPQDVQHLFRMSRVLGRWEIQDVWRMPSANEDNLGQCTGGLNVYPAFEMDVQGLVIDNDGNFFVSDASGIFNLTVPTPGVGTDLAVLGSQVADMTDLTGQGTTNTGRMNYDQTNNLVYYVVYDSPANVNDVVCNLSDPPCRLEAYVFDWSVKKLDSIISVGGYDRFTGSDGTPAQSPSFERPRQFVFMENGPDAGDAYWFSDEDGNAGAVHPNAGKIKIGSRDVLLGDFEKTFTFINPSAGDSIRYRPGGATTLNAVRCQVTDPQAAAGSGSAGVTLTRANTGFGGSIAVVTPPVTVCPAGQGAGQDATNGTLDPQHVVEIGIDNVVATVSVLEVTLFFTRVAHPR